MITQIVVDLPLLNGVQTHLIINPGTATGKEILELVDEFKKLIKSINEKLVTANEEETLKMVNAITELVQLFNKNMEIKNE